MYVHRCIKRWHPSYPDTVDSDYCLVQSHEFSRRETCVPVGTFHAIIGNRSERKRVVSNPITSHMMLIFRYTFGIAIEYHCAANPAPPTFCWRQPSSGSHTWLIVKHSNPFLLICSCFCHLSKCLNRTLWTETGRVSSIFLNNLCSSGRPWCSIYVSLFG